MKTKLLLFLWIALCAIAVAGAVVYVVIREPERPHSRSTPPAPPQETGNSSEDYRR
ncbi:MAG: hypothetical protein J0L91_00010 [Burkholderiales bacterium]|nr:hypothetical protein [Burkholderiales bacterium]